MSQISLGATNTGQIVNLVTNDVQKFEEVILFCSFFLLGSRLHVCLGFLFRGVLLA